MCEIGIGTTPETGITVIGATGVPTTTTVGRRRAGVIIANIIPAIGGEATLHGLPSSALATTSGITVIGTQPTVTILPIILTNMTNRSMHIAIGTPPKLSPMRKPNSRDFAINVKRR